MTNKRAYEDLLSYFDVQEVSFPENLIGIEFIPQFLLGTVLSGKQRQAVIDACKSITNELRGPSITWVTLTTSEITIGTTSKVHWFRRDGGSGYFDIQAQPLIALRKGEKRGIHSKLTICYQDSEPIEENFVFAGHDGDIVRELVINEIQPKNRTVVAVFGAPGVGKSTLINSILGEEVAHTSSSLIGTQETCWYQSKDAEWALVDTEGWNSEEALEDALERLSKEIEYCRSSGSGLAFDAVWYCLSYPFGGISPGETALITAVQRLQGVRVFVVALQSPELIDKNDRFVKEVKRRAAKQHASFFINAEASTMGRNPTPAHGVSALLDATKLAARKRR